MLMNEIEKLENRGFRVLSVLDGAHVIPPRSSQRGSIEISWANGQERASTKYGEWKDLPKGSLAQLMEAFRNSAKPAEQFLKEFTKDQAQGEENQKP